MKYNRQLCSVLNLEGRDLPQAIAEHILTKAAHQQRGSMQKRLGQPSWCMSVNGDYLFLIKADLKQVLSILVHQLLHCALKALGSGALIH